MYNIRVIYISKYNILQLQVNKLDAVIKIVIPARKCLPLNMKHSVTKWHWKSGSIEPNKEGLSNNTLLYIQALKDFRPSDKFDNPYLTIP